MYLIVFVYLYIYIQGIFQSSNLDTSTCSMVYKWSEIESTANDVEPVKVGILKEKTRGASWKHGETMRRLSYPERNTFHKCFFAVSKMETYVFFHQLGRSRSSQCQPKHWMLNLRWKDLKSLKLSHSHFFYSKKKLDCIESSQQNICNYQEFGPF